MLKKYFKLIYIISGIAGILIGAILIFFSTYDSYNLSGFGKTLYELIFGSITIGTYFMQRVPAYVMSIFYFAWGLLSIFTILSLIKEKIYTKFLGMTSCIFGLVSILLSRPFRVELFYLIITLFIFQISIIIISWNKQIFKQNKNEKNKQNKIFEIIKKRKKIIYYTTDLLLTIIFLIIGLTGVILFLDVYNLININYDLLPRILIYRFHHWFGIILMILISIHVDLYWKWIIKISRKIKKNKLKEKSSKITTIYILNIFLLISFCLVIITGIIKFPGFLPYIGINPLITPLNEISFIHDWSGLLSVFLTIFHIIIYCKRFEKTTKNILKQVYRKYIKQNSKIVSILIIIFFVVILIIFSIQNINNNENNESLKFSDEKIDIQGIGNFNYNPMDITAIRTDIFQGGSFSIFDILIYLDNTDQINMKYHFDDFMNTYVIDSINEQKNWWYNAFYDGGWTEDNVFRMDHYPFKEKMNIYFFKTSSSRIQDIYLTFQNEIERSKENNGRIIIQQVTIIGTNSFLTFNDLEVEPHNLRNDIFINDTITAIDVILTLGDNNELSYDLQWYDSIGSAEIVRSYWIDGINTDKSIGRCGFVYEEGSNQFNNFKGNHIHIPSDLRVLNNPEYVKWFWICI